MGSRAELIQFYFGLGLTHKEIVLCLGFRHNVQISERHLRRLLRIMGLYRRKELSDILDVAVYVDQELSKSGQLHGYRWMHLKCIQNGFVVNQETVRLLIKMFDPVGVELRKRRRLRRRQYYNKGPDFTWHMDGYDKLSPYGICIHGCVDGFSRNIVWLEAYRTNSDPKVIGSYYVNAIKIRNQCPRLIRADRGTENGHVRQIQHFLRSNANDSFAGENSFMYGRSTSNQRIESWWGILRKQNAQFWMNLFEQIKDEGLFSGNFLDKSLIQFCFLNIIQVRNRFSGNQFSCFEFLIFYCMQTAP